MPACSEAALLRRAVSGHPQFLDSRFRGNDKKTDAHLFDNRFKALNKHKNQSDLT